MTGSPRRTTLRRSPPAAPLLCGVLAVAGLPGCPSPGPEPADDDDATEEIVDPLSFPVDALGPYRAGWRDWDVTYTPTGATGPRTVRMNLWYPTEDTSGFNVEYLGLGGALFEDPLSLGQASLADPLYDGGYPVMVYSHGWQGWGGTSSDLSRWFASHGWVVIAPDHTGNTILDHQDPLVTSHYVAKPQDLSALLDELESLPSTDPLAGLADTSRVVLAGHSYGTYAAWASVGATFDEAAVDASCAGNGGLPAGECTAEERAAFLSGDLADERVVAAIPLAGSIRRSFFGADGHRSVQGPVMSMTGENDSGNPQEQWDSIDAIDFTWLSLAGGCHQTFALGTCDTLDPAEGFAIVDTYALAFARVHVLGDTDPGVLGILDGSVTVSDKVTFQRKTD